MNSPEYTYWKFDKALDHDMCDKILDLGRHKFKRASVMQGYNKEIRDSSVVWVDEQWVFDLAFQYMRAANENSGWKLDIDASESMQLTRYKKKGFYGFHKDGGGFSVYDKPENKFLHDKTRKISMTILLNDEFEGGSFEFNPGGMVEMKKGDIVFFPSWELHRVNPVTSGVRHSLVGWFLGPKLK